MADGSGKMQAANADQRMQSLVAALRHVGTPLLSAVAEVQGARKNEKNENKDGGAEVAQFSTLVESTVMLANMIVDDMDSANEVEDWVRWAIVQSASQIVASHYRVTGQPISAEAAKPIVEMAGALQKKFKSQMPAADESVPNTVATFRAKAIEALAPVVGVVAQYSFGRAEHALVAEIAERLMKTADQITRSLAPAGTATPAWRLLCWSVLRSAGQIYADCHIAEADRLLYMNTDDRAAYFAQHGNQPPMNLVWQNFNQRMGMLATLAAYLEIPANAQLDAQDWS